MEIIKIEKNKLIFLLSLQDLKEYSLIPVSDARLLKEGYRRIVCDNGISHSFLSGVLVEFFESENGGCEMFVTKLSDEDGVYKDSIFSDKYCIYIFQDLDTLIGACRFLKEQTDRKAYIYSRSDGSGYYLYTFDEIPYLSEFNAVKCPFLPYEYLTEHCNFLGADAAIRLAAL